MVEVRVRHKRFNRFNLKYNFRDKMKKDPIPLPKINLEVIILNSNLVINGLIHKLI